MKNIFLLLLSLSSLHFLAYSQPGTNDATFNTFDDCSMGVGSGFENTVSVSAIQADGKIIVGGQFTYFDGVYLQPRIARLNSNGSLDLAFVNGTGFNGEVDAIAIQPDGKIIVGGYFTSYNGLPINRIIRLNSDGSVDGTFNPGTGFDNYVSSLIILSDGKIIVGGGFEYCDGTLRRSLAILNSDGSLDVSFNTNNGFSGHVFDIACQADGKIIATGAFNAFDGTPINRIARVNTDGTLDLTFGVGTGFNNTGQSVAIQMDGKILVGGNFTTYNGSSGVRIVRLNSDGTIDLTFNAGSGFDNSVSSISIQTDGKLVVGGSFTVFDGASTNYIARLNSDGSADFSFNPGSGFSAAVRTTLMQPDGKILVGGSYNSFNGTWKMRFSRLNADATLDGFFGAPTGFNYTVSSTTIQSDGKIIAGGIFTYFNGTVCNSIARLNENGSMDLSFNSGLGFDDEVYASAVQADGKIIAGGNFTTFNGSASNYLTRMNADGSQDISFNVGTGFDSYVTAIAIQSDGKIIVGGNFTTYNGMPANYLVRLNTDGSMDGTFNMGSGFSEYVQSLVILSDGKIMVGGNFTSYNGTNRYRIARLNSNGTLDAAFNPLSGFNGTVMSIAVQPDGKIIAGGQFTSYAGTTRNRIARINSNGTLDVTFTLGVGGFNQTVSSVILQSDGKVIAAGSFTAYGGNTANHIARLNANGSHDATFISGTGFDENVRSLSLCSDGKVIVGGEFAAFDGVCRNNIARLQGDCNSASTIAPVACDSIVINGITYYSSGAYQQIIPNSVGCDSTITINLTIGLTGNIDLTTIQSNTSLLSIETAATFQWLDCANANSPIVGFTDPLYSATTTGSFSLEITKDGCKDTTTCLLVDQNDFYNEPWYYPMMGEVFAGPTSDLDSCDAEALSFIFGGVAPYSYDWMTQANNSFGQGCDSACHGLHQLKVYDNIGDSLFVDYYVADSINYFNWYSSGIATDTLYMVDENCLFDFGAPIDSILITDQYYLYSASPAPGDYIFTEITYYQGGNMFIHSDTSIIDTTLINLIDFSIYCPAKSIANLVKILFIDEYIFGLEIPQYISTDLTIFPNPGNGLFYVRITNPQDEYSLDVFNSAMSKVFSIDVFCPEYSDRIDLSGMTKGIYFIRLTGANSLIIEKIVIE
jgi:uncharacterized delta-60 repeat protein